MVAQKMLIDRWVLDFEVAIIFAKLYYALWLSFIRACTNISNAMIKKKHRYAILPRQLVRAVGRNNHVV